MDAEVVAVVDRLQARDVSVARTVLVDVKTDTLVCEFVSDDVLEAEDSFFDLLLVGAASEDNGAISSVITSVAIVKARGGPTTTEEPMGRLPVLLAVSNLGW